MFAVQYADSSTDDFAFFEQIAHQQGMGLAHYIWSRADLVWRSHTHSVYRVGVATPGPTVTNYYVLQINLGLLLP